MFIAKFNQTTGESFKADKNGEMPFIGTIVAGKATSTLINGTIFQRESLEPNQLYLCQNVVDPEYPQYPRVEVISKVSALEAIQAVKELGAPRYVAVTAVAEVPAEPALV